MSISLNNAKKKICGGTKNLAQFRLLNEMAVIVKGMGNYNRREYRDAIGKPLPVKHQTEAELQLAAQKMLSLQGLEPKKDNSLHNGRRWSLIKGKRVYHD